MDSRFQKFVNDSPKWFANLIMKKIYLNESSHLSVSSRRYLHWGRTQVSLTDLRFFNFFLFILIALWYDQIVKICLTLFKIHLRYGIFFQS